uniref:Uncharacterized protein n=1 Tax=Calidris pygmaea TaxID=425635 RepID=A0A8C3JCL4_9CHAR
MSCTWSPPRMGYGDTGGGGKLAGSCGGAICAPLHPHCGGRQAVPAPPPPALCVCHPPPKLSLRAVNSSRSAFASFLFAPLFFQRYEAGGSPPDSQLFRCKVLMKVRETPSSKFSLGFGGGGVWGGEPGRVTVPPPPPNPCVCPPPPKSLPRKSFLGVFRSLPSLEKTVGKCLILLKPRASRLVVQLHCKYGECAGGGGHGGHTHGVALPPCPAEPLAVPARCHQDPQPGLPGVREAAGCIRHPALRQQPPRPGTGAGGGRGPLPPNAG